MNELMSDRGKQLVCLMYAACTTDRPAAGPVHVVKRSVIALWDAGSMPDHSPQEFRRGQSRKSRSVLSRHRAGQPELNLMGV